MATSKIPDDEWVLRFEQIGPSGLARELKQTERTIYNRRKAIEGRLRRQLVAPPQHLGTPARNRSGAAHPGRLSHTIENGICLVGSDCHYWPGPPSLMHRAFVAFCKRLKPSLVVLNGDVCDFAQISRYPPPGWKHQPTPQEEIEAAQERLGEIEAAAFKARKIWTLGNHDQRYEVYCATHAEKLKGVKFTSLKDGFPLWEPAWSVWVNNTCVVKHRLRGGIHATRTNTLNSGMSIVTGHLHSAKVTPLTDYNGTRWGVDGGCIADTNHHAFTEYTEDGVLDWRSSFVVLTFKESQLLQPELVLKWDEESVQFRGETIHVSA